MKKYQFIIVIPFVALASCAPTTPLDTPAATHHNHLHQPIVKKEERNNIKTTLPSTSNSPSDPHARNPWTTLLTGT